jgi:hypothetical protein
VTGAIDRDQANAERAVGLIIAMAFQTRTEAAVEIENRECVVGAPLCVGQGAPVPQ